jgi:formylglycine-generating enzyme required for sulfatase activity
MAVNRFPESSGRDLQPVARWWRTWLLACVASFGAACQTEGADGAEATGAAPKVSGAEVFTTDTTAVGATGSSEELPAGADAELRFVRVEPGEAALGSPDDEPCRSDDEEARTATIGRAFSMATTEVTRAAFESLMGYDPSFVKECGSSCPVESVSWHEAAAFCNALSTREKRSPCYRCDPDRGEQARCTEAADPIVSCSGYRLPTEVEWEHAARAASSAAFSRGPIESCMTEDTVASRVGWYKVNSGGLTHPVGQKLANRLGLYDMHGNVSEWVGDWYAADTGADAAVDPVGPPKGTEKVLRGGDWYHNASHARSAHRERIRPDKRLSYVGFRCVRTLEGKP